MTPPQDPDVARPTAPGSSPPSAVLGGGGDGSRLWLGCLGGCGCAFLIAVGLLAAAVFWSIVPGEQIPSRELVGEESIGAARVEKIAADDGISAFLLASLVEWIEAAQRIQQEQMPEELQWLSYLQGSAEGELDDLKKVLPRDATLVLEPPVLSEDGRVERVPWIAAVNVNRYPRLIRLLTRRFFGVIDDPTHQRVRHRGVVVDEFEGGFAAGFVDSTILIASRADDVVLAIDRLLDGTGGVESAASLGELSAELGEWDFQSAVRNQDGVFDSFIESALFSEPPSDDLFDQQLEPAEGAPFEEGVLPLPEGGIALVGFQFDIETEDTARSQLKVTLEQGSDAQEWQAALERSSQHWFHDAQARGLEVELAIASRPSDPDSGAPALLVEIELTGLTVWMADWVDSILVLDDDERSSQPSSRN